VLAAAGVAVRTVLPVPPPAAAPPDVGWPPPRPMYGRIPATMSSTLDALALSVLGTTCAQRSVSITIRYSPR